MKNQQEEEGDLLGSCTFAVVPNVPCTAVRLLRTRAVAPNTDYVKASESLEREEGRGEEGDLLGSCTFADIPNGPCTAVRLLRTGTVAPNAPYVTASESLERKKERGKRERARERGE